MPDFLWSRQFARVRYEQGGAAHGSGGDRAALVQNARRSDGVARRLEPVRSRSIDQLAVGHAISLGLPWLAVPPPCQGLTGRLRPRRCDTPLMKPNNGDSDGQVSRAAQ